MKQEDIIKYLTYTNKSSHFSENYIMFDLKDFTRCFKTEVLSLSVLESTLKVGLEFVIEKNNFIIFKRLK